MAVIDNRKANIKMWVTHRATFFFFFNILHTPHSGENTCCRKTQKSHQENHGQKSLSEDFHQPGHPGGWKGVLGALLGWTYFIQSLPTPFHRWGAWGLENPSSVVYGELMCGRNRPPRPLPLPSDRTTFRDTHSACLFRAKEGLSSSLPHTPMESG